MILTHGANSLPHGKIDKDILALFYGDKKNSNNEYLLNHSLLHYTPSVITDVDAVYQQTNPLNNPNVPIFDASLSSSSGNIDLALDTTQYPNLTYELFVFLSPSIQVRITPYNILNDKELSLVFENHGMKYRRLGLIDFINSISFETWHHIAWEISDTLKLFIDGQLVMSDAYNTKEVFVSRFGITNGNWFYGSYFMQIALWSKLLSGGDNYIVPPNKPYMKF